MQMCFASGCTSFPYLDVCNWTVFEVCLHRGDRCHVFCAQAARGLLKQMQAEGQRPTPVTFNTLLRGYARRGRAGRQVTPCFS
jgi:hypothetical protein